MNIRLRHLESACDRLEIIGNESNPMDVAIQLTACRNTFQPGGSFPNLPQQNQFCIAVAFRLAFRLYCSPAVLQLLSGIRWYLKNSLHNVKVHFRTAHKNAQEYFTGLKEASEESVADIENDPIKLNSPSYAALEYYTSSLIRLEESNLDLTAEYLGLKPIEQGNANRCIDIKSCPADIKFTFVIDGTTWSFGTRTVLNRSTRHFFRILWDRYLCCQTPHSYYKMFAAKHFMCAKRLEAEAGLCGERQRGLLEYPGHLETDEGDYVDMPTHRHPRSWHRARNAHIWVRIVTLCRWSKPSRLAPLAACPGGSASNLHRPIPFPASIGVCCMAALHRGETHDPVHCTFINLIKVPNEGPLIFLVPASNQFMFCTSIKPIHTSIKLIHVMKWCLLW